MKNVLILIFCVTSSVFAQNKKDTSNEKYHYVCIQSNDTYHDNQFCSSLQMCTGGRIRKIKDVGQLKPCKKCAKPQYNIVAKGFNNIKNVLGVKDKAQIADSLGSPANAFHRNGYTLRISGAPGSKTVNQIEYFFDQPVKFNEDSLLAASFQEKLGLNFSGCKSDTIRSSTPHPVTGVLKRDFTIEYRGCAVVEPREAYENTSLYFYELSYFAVERDNATYVDKILLALKVDKP